jgi:hypothetical protein
MPITDNIAWDERLEAFKGSDVNDYVTTTATEATECAQCGQPLEIGAALSLIVEIQQNQDSRAGGRRYTAHIHHRHCQAPDLILRATPLPLREERQPQ